MPRVLGCGVLACVEYRPLDGLLAGVTHRPGDDITLWSPSWTIEGLPTEVQYILYHTITISAVMGPYANTADHHGPLASATKPEQFQQSCFTEYCVTRRTLQTPGTAEENKRQETPTTNPNDRQPAQRTYQAPGTIERAARRTTPTSTAAVHASSSATTRHHYPHPTGSPPDPLSQRSPL